MPRAPYDTTLTFGTMAGGVGVFTPVLVVPGRAVPVTRQTWPLLPDSRIVLYVTWTGAAASEGTVAAAPVQLYTRDYKTAWRVRAANRPGITYCIVSVNVVFPQVGASYRRAWCVVNPP